MKKVFALLGLGIATGTVAYTIWVAMNKKRNVVADGSGDLNDDINSRNTDHEVDCDTRAEERVAYVKNAAANDIVTRHEETAQKMNNAVDSIYSKTEAYEENSCELDRISKELDDLLLEA